MAGLRARVLEEPSLSLIYTFRSDEKAGLMDTAKHLLRERLRAKLISSHLRIVSAWHSVGSAITRSKRMAKRWYALQWQYIYRAHYRLLLWKARYGFLATTALLILLIMGSGILAPTLQGTLELYFSTDEGFAGLQTLLVTSVVRLLDLPPLPFRSSCLPCRSM